jgi:hypothetical protein
MPRLALPLLAVLVAALPLPGPAEAQVRRCVDAQGNSVFTDRACSSMDAVPRGEPVAPGGAHHAGGFGRQGCAAGPRQLLDEVRGALESRDVNQLATHYHWAGTGSGAARSLMGQLEAIAQRPLVAIDLVFPAAPEPVPDTGFASLAPAQQPVRDDGFTVQDAAGDGTPNAAAEVPEPLRSRPPYAIRVEQMSGVGDAGSSQTVFNLRRHAGCWFIQL